MASSLTYQAHGLARPLHAEELDGQDAGDPAVLRHGPPDPLRLRHRLRGQPRRGSDLGAHAVPLDGLRHGPGSVCPLGRRARSTASSPGQGTASSAAGW